VERQLVEEPPDDLRRPSQRIRLPHVRRLGKCPQAATGRASERVTSATPRQAGRRDGPSQPLGKRGRSISSYRSRVGSIGGTRFGFLVLHLPSLAPEVVCAPCGTRHCKRSATCPDANEATADATSWELVKLRGRKDGNYGYSPSVGGALKKGTCRYRFGNRMHPLVALTITDQGRPQPLRDSPCSLSLLRPPASAWPSRIGPPGKADVRDSQKLRGGNRKIYGFCKFRHRDPQL
jgi:hypothetical protein